MYPSASYGRRSRVLLSVVVSSDVTLCVVRRGCGDQEDRFQQRKRTVRVFQRSLFTLFSMERRGEGEKRGEREEGRRSGGGGTLSVLRQSPYTLFSMSFDDSKCESLSLHGYATDHAEIEKGGALAEALQCGCRTSTEVMVSVGISG
jgi:hypothetical protein